jgi:hypothetical protein
LKDSSPRARWLLLFLWLAVSFWGLGLGAKLFELVVLIPAWSADPPRSLNLLPYGPRWPNNPGAFFQPLSALLLLATLGTLTAGWRSTAPFKVLLWIPCIALLAIWAATPTLFWPMIQELYWASTGRQPLAPEAAKALAHKWVVYDWARAGLIALGFLCALRAISTHHRAYRL